jgi:citrate/tricarballylate utilization protein
MSGGFYAIFAHDLMITLFAPVFLFVLLALGLGVHRFWHEISAGAGTPAPCAEITGSHAGEVALNALSLKYLGGGHGEGCNNEDDRWTLWRRRFHHTTFYGFLLCFAATGVATLYHYLLGLSASYELPSLPKLLGGLGGVGLLLGTTGLFILNLRRHPLHGDRAQMPMDIGFMVLLFFTSLSGLTSWLWRGTVATPALLAIHLGVAMALLVTLPYGKFAHGVYRVAALLKWAMERRQPDRLKLDC